MNIKEIIDNCLKKEKYYISIYSDNIYIYNYLNIILYNNNLIMIELENNNYKIYGNGLKIIKSYNKELLIKGDIIKIEKENK